MGWEKMGRASSMREGMFKVQVRKFLRSRSEVIDCARYEVHGRGCADMLVLLKGARGFFIEFKGRDTGYSDKKQAHQEAWADGMREYGYTVLKLDPDTAWKEQITETIKGLSIPS